MTLLDYAWTKPSAAQIAAGGYAGVLRYLSHDSGKNLSGGERDALLAAGLSIGLVWETTATRAGQGYAAGQQDVQAAEAQASALGYPAGCPIFYAVDYDAAPAAVVPYFQGVQGLARWPVGVYGSANVIEGVPVPWKWQTTAWSHGRVSAQAHLYQTLLASLPGCDLNKVLRPVPLWSTGAGSSGGLVSGVVHIPTAPTFPTTQTPTQEDDMHYFTVNGTGYAASATRTARIDDNAVATAIVKARAGDALSPAELDMFRGVQAALREPAFPIVVDQAGTEYAIGPKGPIVLHTSDQVTSIAAMRDGATVTSSQTTTAAQALGQAV